MQDRVDARLLSLQKGNDEKLEQMRKTVDEKLHDTLEKRLGESFKLVSERLEQVQKGLGEMQNLASDVGGLKRALTNVKTRGVMGEAQLGALLEQFLAPAQYAANVKIRPRSNELVEFAVKLPGAGEGRRCGCRWTRSSPPRTTSALWRLMRPAIWLPWSVRPRPWNRAS